MKKLLRIFESAAQKKQRLATNLASLLDTHHVDIEKVRSVIAEGVDPNLRIRTYTGLQRASLGRTASLDAVSALLEAGGNPFLPVEFGLKRYKLSSLIIDRPDIKERLLKAEAEWERIHGPQPPIKTICPAPKRKAA